MPNSPSCFMCTAADAPGDPAMKRVKHSGVLWYSFSIYLGCGLHADWVGGLMTGLGAARLYDDWIVDCLMAGLC